MGSKDGSRACGKVGGKIDGRIGDDGDMSKNGRADNAGNEGTDGEDDEDGEDGRRLIDGSGPPGGGAARRK